MIPPQQCSSHVTAVSVQTHKGSAKTPIRESPSAVTRSKLNTIFAFSCCWQRETILSVLTLCSRVNPCSDWGMKETNALWGCRKSLWSLWLWWMQWRCQCKKRGGLWIWEFDQMCLVMNEYSLQVSLPGGTGHLPLIQHPLTSRSLSNRKGMIYHLWIFWDSLKTSALGQREEKQQQDDERQEWTVAVQRPQTGKERPRCRQAAGGDQVSEEGQSPGRTQH